VSGTVSRIVCIVVSLTLKKVMRGRQYVLRLEECKRYMDKGSELTDYYCPTGFRFLTNTNWIG
jgi:hypothetical protein